MTAREIFEAALNVDPQLRDAFVRDTCDKDAEKLQAVRGLLEAHASPAPEGWIDATRTGREPESDAVKFTPGARVGDYEILGVLGKGGMGEVYRARDLTLPKLEVAIKTLPRELAHDSQRVARFNLEADVLASFKHPNIGYIYRAIEWESSRLLILELVEGETLAERIAGGALPARNALAIAKQIADALEHAHEKGIIHRDLKPANVKVHDDHVKVLDFGIARVLDIDWARTVTGATYSGSGASTGLAPAGIVGTAPYMSPEQASGKEVDQRSDIWSFGCVLFEMFAGAPLFTGETIEDIRAEVLKGAIDLGRLPSSTPPAARRLIHRCLRRDKKSRLRHMADARLDIDDAMVELAASPSPESKKISRREAAAWLVAAGSLGLAGSGALLLPRPKTNSAYSINPPEGAVLTGPHNATIPIPQFAVSPDGKWIVFAAAKGRDLPGLWVQPTNDKMDQRSLPGTAGAAGPFWAPESDKIAFFAEGGRLMWVRRDGSQPAAQILEAVSDPRGGSWGPDDIILYASGNSEIYRVNRIDKKPLPVTARSQSEEKVSHRWPHFLPDGRHFLYTVRSGPPGRRGIWIGDVQGDPAKALLVDEGIDSNALYSEPGHILYLDHDQLKARAFDRTRLAFVHGQDAQFIVGGVGRSTLGSGAVSISSTGVLAWAGPMKQIGQLKILDSKGNPESGGSLDDEPKEEYEYTDFALSPDNNETWLAATRTDHKRGWVDIALRENMKNGKWRPWRPLLEQHSCTINASAVWSPDGDQVVYRSNPHGVIEIFKKKPKESGGQGMPYLSDETLRFDIEFSSLALSDWSIDRQSRESRILFSVPTRKGSGFDLWYASSAHGDRPKPWEFTDGIHSDQIHGSLSPDGRFLAYSSNESGRYEVYIQKLKSKDARTCVSKAPKHDGGSEPRWSRNGRELYYLSEYPRGLMAVSIDAEGEPGSPREISSPVAVPQSVNPLRTNYVPRKDGGFIVNILNPNSKVGSPSITIFTDWPSRIR